ncbi:hypothetical protein AAGQ96_12770 [Pantoea sp. MBD-2R]|uniref:hypothetical protein n=1 Tax=Pantoea sp. MBD-2R TaxID=3141540 RepID=UPI00318466CB
MSLLYDKQLDDTLAQNGGESLKKIDAGALQGIGIGLSTGLRNAGTSLERIAANTGNAQMRVSGAQMLAGAAITGSDETQRAGLESAEAAPPTEAQLPQYKNFDSEQVGTVGTILGGLAQQAPSLAAMVANPVAGIVLAAAQGQTEAHAEGAKIGLTGEDLENYGAVGGLTAGAGAAIPGFAGFGKGAVLYGSRFLLGGAENSATGEIDRWGRAAILDDAGFHDQARQMRQADAASRVTEFALGGAFGLIGGRSRHHDEVASPKISPEVTDLRTTASPASADQPPYSAYVDSLQEKASQLLSRGDRKVWQSEVANSQRIIDRLSQQRNQVANAEIKGSGKSLSQARAARSAQLSDIDRQIAQANSRLSDARDTLAEHSPGGKLFEAKAELSRIDQRLREEHANSVTSVHEDAATAHLIHDHYVTESAPGLATDASTEAGHVRAMDSANESIHAGKSVDVSEHINEERTFLAKNDIDTGNIERGQLSDNATQRIDRIAQASDEQAIPQPQTNEPRPGVISEFNERPFETVREQVQALRETHPELADTIAPHLESIEAEHTAAHQNSQVYDVAATCALKYGN